ncbi:MAG: T9SS type A sorting domain-containing protein [Bacteroidetes bacterium]|nr:T9SS type A sorting domain-containing protein [Bacteroidota bacterium]
MKFFKIILGITALFNFAQAQISNESLRPKSIEFGEYINASIPEYSFDIARTSIDSIIHGSRRAYQISLLHATSINTTTQGIWSTLPNGDKIWRLKIQSPKALGLNLYFSKYELAPGATLHIYSPSYKKILGAYTSRNHDASNLFATSIIEGESCIIEYYEPRDMHIEQPFEISEIAHYFRGLKSAENFNDAESCLVNVTCSEGDSFRLVNKAVVRILAKNITGTVWCTGTIMNNTAQDCKPYVLTAAHCAEGTTEAQFNQWIYYFNYESPTCANPSNEPSTKSIAGSIVRAQSIDGGDSSSDFCFVELKSAIPTSYQANFAGWSNANVPSVKSVSINHPVGDIKKIATSQIPTNSVSYGGFIQNTHWKASWSNTPNGNSFTMGGSSGSTLLNRNGLVVGTLTGGPTVDCNTIAIFDYYGKMSVHWNPAGSTNSSQRLKEWLDPNNSGVTSLGLKQGNACPFVSSIQSAQNGMEIKAFIEKNTLHIDGIQTPVQVNITDMQGKNMGAYTADTNRGEISLEHLTMGVYIIRLQAGNAVKTIKFIRA